MNLESEIRMNLKAMMYDMQSPNPFKSLDEKKAIIERYAQNLLDILQENYGKIHEQTIADECIETLNKQEAKEGE